MSTETTATHRSKPTGRPEADTRRPAATLQHRTDVHPIPQDDCSGCLPAPCVCGRHLCPDAVAHRLDVASSERYWIEVAA